MRPSIIDVKQAERDRIADAMAAFLRSGGRVKQYGIGQVAIEAPPALRSLEGKQRTMRLQEIERQRPLGGGRRRWSKEEDDVLRQEYPTRAIKELCALLPNRTAATIYQRAAVLKLKKSARNTTPHLSA